MLLAIYSSGVVESLQKSHFLVSIYFHIFPVGNDSRSPKKYNHIPIFPCSLFYSEMPREK